MKTICRTGYVTIPEGITITIKAKVVTVKGPRGTLVKDLKHIPIDMQLIEDGKKIKIDRWFVSGKAPASIRTACSHIENCIKGVTVGYEYKMRFVYAHFPINFTIDKSGQKCEIRNFLGEKVVRKVDALEGAHEQNALLLEVVGLAGFHGAPVIGKVVLAAAAVKDEIVVSGNSIENVSKTCALISMVCTVKRKDIRKFLDGIYVSKKGHIVKD